jgi:hypothetical protein
MWLYVLLLSPYELHPPQLPLYLLLLARPFWR